MLVLLLGLAIILFVVCFIGEGKTEDFKSEIFMGLAVCSMFIIIGLVITISILAPKAASESIYDDKIAIYEEDNAAIESFLERIAGSHVEYEQEAFAEGKTESKYDAIVQQQLEVYADNNAKIKDLKLEKSNIPNIKWIIYFGK